MLQLLCESLPNAKPTRARARVKLTMVPLDKSIIQVSHLIATKAKRTSERAGGRAKATQPTSPPTIVNLLLAGWMVLFACLICLVIH